ncbi:PAS domain-containing protein [Pseudomarimonas salicorniae]|uniref:histidine kinase n=1 Tax=Pseudomarimonas salicorniae TaxID=2933270 RepID=A0ABT0GF93_9GAMM|nr:PAS domain-containing protein [Lysobacter sp. CAU 1642]MCK7592707.1 PAS domain-containing protein [Lysobacter sp. CAU 1642]
MDPIGHNALSRMTMAVGFAAAAITLRAALDPWVGGQVPFITLFAAVAASALFAGTRPAMLTALLGGACAFWLWPPGNTVAVLAALVAYLLACGLIIWLVSRARRRSREARQAAGQLTDQRRLLQEMIDALPMLVAYVDREHRYQFNNRAYGDWFEVAPESLAGRHVRELAGEEAYRRIEPHIQRALAGEMVRYEAQLPLSSGTRDLAITYAPHDVDGRVEGFFAIIEDISERRRTEHARAHLAAIVDSTSDAIVSKSLQGIVQSWNAGAERLFGWSAEEMVGQSITRIIPDERLHEEADILSRLSRGEHVIGMETERRRRDGHLVPISLTVSPVFDAQGRVIGASKIARDITERRRREAERQEEARRKDEFLATLAHELRNPLAPILNAAQAMQVDALSDPGLLAARSMIERQARHMSRLVDDLLDLSRISHGQIVLRREPCVLQEVFRSALEACEPTIERAGIHLAWQYDEQAITVEGDPTRLAQILSNLVGNAAKFTERGGSIEVDLSRQGDEARLEVEDTGIGIDPTQIEAIFGMFAQAEGRGEQVSSGLGIGLWLSRHLAEMHGGSLTAHSEGRGHGSRFTLRLPITAAACAEPEQPTAAGGEGAVAGLSLLVADDNVDAATSLAMLLRLEGHQVEVVHDGEAAVARLSGQRFDVALLDLGMPGCDGYEVARRVRAMDGGDDLRLVALTGWGQEEARQRSRDAGFDAHLTKPAEAGQIEETLRRLCDRGQGRPIPG